jgi:hypothetical protein
VIFVDASVEELDDFCISKVTENSKITFTTHAASPGYIVDLCKEIYKKAPPAYLIHIKGYEWEFMEGITAKAIENMELAFEYLKPFILNPELLIAGDAGVKLREQ